MRIEIRYSRSLAPHFFDLDIDDISNLLDSNDLEVVQETPKGHKRITITGTAQELSLFGEVLMNHAEE